VGVGGILFWYCVFLYWCCLLFGGLVVLFWILTCFVVCFACFLVGSYLRAIMCLLLSGVLRNLLGGGWVCFGLVGGAAKL